MKRRKRNVYNEEEIVGFESPPIPKGYRHISGTWDRGFVIERESDGSQFIWIPLAKVSHMKMRGKDLLSEQSKTENKKIVNYKQDSFHKHLLEETQERLESINKYEGFFISRYSISENRYTGKLNSVKNGIPWNEPDYSIARIIVSDFEKSKTVKGYLATIIECDLVIDWLTRYASRINREIAFDLAHWGKYRIALYTK